MNLPMPTIKQQITPHAHKTFSIQALRKARNKRALMRRLHRFTKWMEMNSMDEITLIGEES